MPMTGALFTAYLTQDMVRAQEMFRRRSFNYETGNNDDHAKNFSFIFDGINRSVSPEYDITECRDANHGFHSSLAYGKEHPIQEDFLIIVGDAGLTKKQSLIIID